MASRPAILDMTFYLPAPKMAAWFVLAQPGEMIEYARGAALDTKHGSVRQVAEWVRAGTAVAHKQRAGDGMLVHLVRKAAPPEQPGNGKRIRRDAEFEETPEGRLFMLLVRCANLGLPCPSLAEMSDRISLRDRRVARYLLSKLVECGRITQRLDGKQRIVTICETGRRTLGVSA